MLKSYDFNDPVYLFDYVLFFVQDLNSLFKQNQYQQQICNKLISLAEGYLERIKKSKDINKTIYSNYEDYLSRIKFKN